MQFLIRKSTDLLILVMLSLGFCLAVIDSAIQGSALVLFSDLDGQTKYLQLLESYRKVPYSCRIFVEKSVQIE